MSVKNCSTFGIGTAKCRGNDGKKKVICPHYAVPQTKIMQNTTAYWPNLSQITYFKHQKAANSSSKWAFIREKLIVYPF